jgi:hypothetical protein
MYKRAENMAEFEVVSEFAPEFHRKNCWPTGRRNRHLFKKFLVPDLPFRKNLSQFHCHSLKDILNSGVKSMQEGGESG